MDAEDVLAGARQVAWELCQAAELNVDQTRAAALIAQPMHAAWGHARDDAELTSQTEGRAVLPLVGTLVRLLLVGGGGRGETRNLNMAPVP